MAEKLALLFPNYRNEIESSTGEWRFLIPVIDYEKCRGCGICARYCPDNLIELEEKGKKKIATIDYRYCKGCGICVDVCPLKCIDLQAEKMGLREVGDISDLIQPLPEKDVMEIVWYGRGGMGVVTASELTATAVLYGKRYSQSIPFFGPERRGAPIKAFTRVSKKPIRIKSDVHNPDMIVFLDPSLMRREIFKGLRVNGSVLINSPNAYPLKSIHVFYLDATRIALETLGRPIVSTAMASAALKVTKMADLKDLLKAIRMRFEGEIMKKNLLAAKRAYKEVREVK